MYPLLISLLQSIVSLGEGCPGQGRLGRGVPAGEGGGAPVGGEWEGSGGLGEGCPGSAVLGRGVPQRLRILWHEHFFLFLKNTIRVVGARQIPETFKKLIFERPPLTPQLFFASKTIKTHQ